VRIAANLAPAAGISPGTMKATDILKNEHRVIEQAMDALETMAARARQEHKLARDDAAAAIDFIRAFADKFHHAKEEDLLFVAMEAAGFPRQAGPIAVMLHEHDFGRNCVSQMSAAVDAAAAGEQAAQQRFASAAEQFINMLRGHIQKEDQILYAMADDAFDDETQATLLVDFDKAEAAQGGAAVRDRYVDVARRLHAQYGAAASR
jgi:hemerythrin-like domain-containing protein